MPEQSESEPEPSEVQQQLPELTGRRVALRPFRDTDLDAVLEAADDPLIPLITTIPSGVDTAGALAYIERQRDALPAGIGYSFAVAERRDPAEAVGQIGLWLRDADVGRGRIGYWIRPSARRRGLAADALATVSEWAVSLPWIRRLELLVEPANEGSWRAAESAGFQREGVLRAFQPIGGEQRDLAMYARLPARAAPPEH